MPAYSGSPISPGRRAALEVLGILPRQDAAPTTPVASSTAHRTAPSTAAELIDWSAVVAEENTRLGLPQPGGAPLTAAQPQGCPAPRAAKIDWSTIVEEQNSAAGFKGPGANIDPALAAHLAGSPA